VTLESVKFALYLGAAFVVALSLHEYAHAAAADRLGDLTPRRSGRLTLNPVPHADPFGTVVLPLLMLLLVAAGQAFLPVFGVAKPMPLNPMNLRDTRRGEVWVIVAGLLANLALAVLAGVGLRFVGGEVWLLLVAVLRVNVIMFVFQLMPVPGLDGGKLLARVLPYRPREVFRNLEQYLTLFLLVIFFLLSAPIIAIVNALGNALCTIIVGGPCL
jgi:Zn-dependent protease